MALAKYLGWEVKILSRVWACRELKVFLKFISVFIMCTCVDRCTCEFWCPWRLEGIRYPGAAIWGGCEMPSDWGPLQEQQVILMTEPYLFDVCELKWEGLGVNAGFAICRLAKLDALYNLKCMLSYKRLMIIMVWDYCEDFAVSKDSFQLWSLNTW